MLDSRSVMKKLVADPSPLLLDECVSKLVLLDTELSISSISGLLPTTLLEDDEVISNGNISSARALPLVTYTVSPLSGFHSDPLSVEPYWLQYWVFC